MDKKNISRNGFIELMRFIFASSVIIFHINRDFFGEKKVLFHVHSHAITMFGHGFIGVEFFFILSGFLMAKSIYKKINTPGDDKSLAIGEETIAFLWKKVKAILPYYIPICIVTIPLLVILHRPVSDILWRLPSFFLLQRTGMNTKGLIGVSWYISSMLIAMAIIYPICRKYYKTYTALIAPFAGIMLIGVMMYLTGDIQGYNDWFYITYKSNVRALAEVGLGATCFEVCRRISGRTFGQVQRRLLSAILLISYAVVLMYAVTKIDSSFSSYAALMLCVGITLSFSGQCALVSSPLFQNKICAFLGSISLPMYLWQNFVRNIYTSGYVPVSGGMLYVSEYAVIIFLAVLLHMAVVAWRQKSR